MVKTRPHIISWITQGAPGGTNEEGFALPDEHGVSLEAPCRFCLGGVKVFKNEDSTESFQIGQIRVDAGQQLPDVGTVVTVRGEQGTVQFMGPVRERYKGQLSRRLEV